MDVRLPDGTVVTNVPEGITQAELMRRLGKQAPDDTAARAAAAGASMRDGKVNWGAELEKQAIDEQGLGGRVFRSLGAGFADIPKNTRIIGIITAMRRQIKSDRQPFLASSQITAIKSIGLLCC